MAYYWQAVSRTVIDCTRQRQRLGSTGVAPA